MFANIMMAYKIPVFSSFCINALIQSYTEYAAIFPYLLLKTRDGKTDNNN